MPKPDSATSLPPDARKHPAPGSTPCHASVGIFDSGVGGLSVLRHIRTHLPHEHLLYFADSGYVPYGDKSGQMVADRVLAVAEFLVERGIKALVVACNTGTVVAIELLRARYPGLPIVGVEPGLRPAAAATRNGKIGVLATAATLSSEKFRLLRDQICAASGAHFLLQPCVGLADRIELGEFDSEATMAMLERYIVPLLDQGADTLVLGSTHYPLARASIERVIARASHHEVALVETGDAVARQLVRLLSLAGMQRATGSSSVEGFTTAGAMALETAFFRLIGIGPAVREVASSVGSCLRLTAVCTPAGSHAM